LRERFPATRRAGVRYLAAIVATTSDRVLHLVPCHYRKVDPNASVT
jgi:hypothetical protein